MNPQGDGIIWRLLSIQPVRLLIYSIMKVCFGRPANILLLLFSLFSLYSRGQELQISGRIKDTITGKDCSGTVVEILKLDSSLVGECRSEKDGSFSFKGSLHAGNYLLFLSHPAHESLYQPITISNNLPLDLGILVLIPKGDSLASVTIISSFIRPHIKGDTLEYNTANIRIRVNANVEEMLGRLPGLQVDPNGNITYNGERVQQLLVDGEDLFGNDPTIITRNFDASRIAKVQLLDRKSDRTIFSGIDDGQRSKTLNLVLKEDSKNGFFGKAEVGGNTEGNYNTNGLLAAFRKREQFTALGMASNTGVLGFSSNSGGSQTKLSVLQWNNDPLGTSAGYGIPRFAASGLHYANTWNGHEDHIAGNYQYGHVFTQPVTSTHIIQTLTDTSYIQDQQSRSVNQQDQHSLNMLYDLVPDSLSAWKFNLGGVRTNGQNQFNANGNNAFNAFKVNSSERSIRSNTSHNNWDGNISWQIHAKHRSRRTFSVSAGLQNLDDKTNGYLYSLNNYYLPDGNLQHMDTVDQRKKIDNHASSISTSLNYTEPLWGNTMLGLSYGISYNSSRALQATFDKGDGKYLDEIDSLSSNYLAHTTNHQAGLTLQGGRKFSYTIGADVFAYASHQLDQVARSELNYHYINFAPRGFITWVFNPTTNLSLLYGGRTQQPSITELQPVKNNNDPLHITIGNPALRPGFNQNFNLSFRSIRALMININLIADITSNSISTRTSTDSLGRQISQPVNVNGGSDIGLNASITKRVLGLDLTLRSNMEEKRSFNFVNTDLSKNESYTIGSGFSLIKNVPDKYMTQIHTTFTYLDSRTSVDLAQPIHYWSQLSSFYLALYFLKGFDIVTGAIYKWQQKTPVFTGNNWTMAWNASVSRNLLNNLLVLRFQVNNLLDQNTGISRSNIGNINTQTSSNILGRYWLLSATYRFDKKAKNK